ncbi:MAG TPA: LysE family transporter [Flavilitoribacter sp.]|nr:LysE family transporter [Flavilitoribacter sp.]HMQ88492.1 LysE family transporter [Flavilitoribacter sp.]
MKLGLVLAAMTGPIFFSLIQAGVEYGIRAGVAVGAGVWISDILFVLATYSGFESLQSWVKWDAYGIPLGVAGAIILVVFGGFTLLRAHRQKSGAPGVRLPSTYAALWLKGFLINTINPFTVFFWITVMGIYVLAENWNLHQATLFFAAILSTIFLTDFVKVVMAKRIRPWLRDGHVLLIRRISGIVLIVFGLILLFRVLVLRA